MTGKNTFRVAVMVGLFVATACGTGRAAVGDPATQAHYHYLRALLEESEGNMRVARDELLQAISLVPDSAHLMRALAELQFRLGQMDAARQAADAALALAPDNLRTLLLGGQIAWAVGQLSVAEERFGRAVELAPDDVEPLISLATVLSGRDPDAAILLYERYVDKHPGQVAMWERLAGLYQAVGRIADAERAWNRVLELDPGALRARLAAAQIAEVHTDTTTAIGHYEAVLARDPLNLPILLQVGELRYRADEMQAAQEAFARAQELSPESPSANFWLALLHEHDENWEKAIVHLERVEGGEADPGIQLRLAYYYSQLGRFKPAIAILRSLSEAEPENLDLLNYLAIAYEQDGQLKPAAAALERLVEIDTDNASHHFHLATVYDRMKDFPRAERALKTAIALDPDHHLALNYLGYSYADRNRHLDAAEEMLVKAVALDPENPAYLDSLGWVYYRQGKLESATDFLMAAARRSDDPVIWEHLGIVHEERGNLADGIHAFDRSLISDPDQPAIVSRVRRIERALPPPQRIGVFVVREEDRFAGVARLQGLARLRVCVPRPCFSAQVSFDYASGDLRMEIPGPFGAPALMVVKSSTAPAQFGTLHPAFAAAEAHVVRATERLWSLLTGAVFQSADGRIMAESARARGRRLQGSGGPHNGEMLWPHFVFDQRRGALHRLEWHTAEGVVERITVRSPSRRPGALPSEIRWQDIRTGFSITFTMVSPVLSRQERPLPEVSPEIPTADE